MQTYERENSHAEKKVALYKRPFKAAGSYIKDADREIGARHGKKTQFAIRALSLGLSLMTARGISETTNDAFFSESRVEAAKSLVSDTLSLPVSLGKLTIELIGDGFDKLEKNVHFGNEGNSSVVEITPQAPDATNLVESAPTTIDVTNDSQFETGNLADCDPNATPAYEEINEGETIYGLVMQRNPLITDRGVALNISYNEFMNLNPNVTDADNVPVGESVQIPTGCTNL